MKLEGIHHVTAITGDAPQNVDFYARVLGLRLVKKTVNQDDPTVYHLFYGDEEGAPGNDITFFEYPGARRGHGGRGDGAHRRAGASAPRTRSTSGRSGSPTRASPPTTPKARSPSPTPRGSATARRRRDRRTSR